MFNWSKYHSISAVTTAHSNELYWKSSAKAAVDIALYDVYCQYQNVPLYALLGGKKEIHTDITVSVDEPVLMAKEAKKHIEKDFKY